MKTTYQESRRAASDRSCRRLRWGYEYMFLLNLVWPVVWIERSTHKYTGGPVIAAYFFRFVHKTVPFLSERDSIVRLEQIVWSLICAAVLFIFLRIVLSLVAADAALQMIAGASAVATLPLAVLLYPGIVSDSAYYQVETYKPALILEIVFILICGIFYHQRKSIFSTPVMLVILTAHFAFLTLLTDSYDNFLECIRVFRDTDYYHPWRRTLSVCSLRLLFDCGFIVVGFLASLTWMRYLACVRRPGETASQ